MSDNEIKRLHEFGLTALQSRVYLTLLQLGRSRASQISLTMGILRPEVYRALHELSSKGLVQRNTDSPSTYVAVPPNRALSILYDRLNTRLTALKHEKKDLAKSLSAYSTVVDEIADERFSLITGGANLILKTRQMIAEAHNDVAAIISTYGIKRIKASGQLAAYVGAKRRGVRIRLVAEIDESCVSGAQLLSKHLKIRQIRDLLFYIVIVDKKQMAFGPAVTDQEMYDSHKRETDLWTNSHRFISGMYELFETIWPILPEYENTA